MNFLGKLSVLIERLQAIPNAIDNLTSAIRTAGEKDSPQNNVDNNISAVIRLPEELERKRAVEQEKQHRVQRLIAYGTWAAVLAASVYGCITFCQWLEMQKQTINSARAWVGYQLVKDSNLPIVVDRVEITPRLAVEAHFTIENFGNGPAIKVIPTFWVETDTNLSMLKKTATFMCNSSVHFATGTVPTSPGIHNPGPMGFILFPKQTYTDFQTWSGDAMPSLRWINVMGCVAYLDQFKSWHWTRFSILIGDGINQISNNSPRKMYTLFNDTDETGEKDQNE
jgi:hypothetical protein